MITELSRLSLLLWSDRMRLPLADVLANEEHYERLTQRLIAANCDALDLVTASTSNGDRATILKAAALMRAMLHPTPPEE
jgi:hypothetical protein